MTDKLAISDPPASILARKGDALAVMRALLERWCLNVAASTKRARFSDLEVFARALGLTSAEEGAWALLDLDLSKSDPAAARLAARDKVLAFVDLLKLQHREPTTISRYVSTLRGCVVEANTQGLPWMLPKIRTPQVVAYGKVQSLPQAKVESVISFLSKHGSARDYATMLLYYDTALRSSTVQRLRVADFDLESRSMVVWTKGGKTERRTMSRRQTEAVAARIRELEYDHQALLEDRSYSALYQWIQRIGLRHPHAIRHTSATVIANKTGDVRLVQSLLGHAQLVTSQVYIDRLRDEPGRATAILAGEWKEDDGKGSSDEVPRGAGQGDDERD